MATICENTPPADPHYLNFPNYSWPSGRLVVSLISGQGYFTFLYGHTKHNIHNREGGRKENKQSRTWVVQAQEERSLWYFSSILWAITNVYSSETPTKSPGMLTHLLTLANPASQSTGSSSCSLLPTAQFCRLFSSASFSWLPPSWFWLWDLLSVVFFRSRGRSRTKALCVGFSPKQTKRSSEWHPHPHTEKRMPPIVSHI